MSDSTPRTDEVSNRAWDGTTGDYSPYVKMLNHARQLERELAEAQAELTRMQQENK